MEKLIITAAICGAEVTKEHNPAVPYTLEEIVREAKSAYDAGASIIHLHVRMDDGTPTQSKDRFQQACDAIRAVCPDVMRHRIGLTYEAEAENVNQDKIIAEILNVVEVP